MKMEKTRKTVTPRNKDVPLMMRSALNEGVVVPFNLERFNQNNNSRPDHPLEACVAKKDEHGQYIIDPETNEYVFETVEINGESAIDPTSWSRDQLFDFLIEAGLKPKSTMDDATLRGMVRAIQNK